MNLPKIQMHSQFELFFLAKPWTWIASAGSGNTTVKLQRQDSMLRTQTPNRRSLVVYSHAKNKLKLPFFNCVPGNLRLQYKNKTKKSYCLEFSLLQGRHLGSWGLVTNYQARIQSWWACWKQWQNLKEWMSILPLFHRLPRELSRNDSKLKR